MEEKDEEANLRHMPKIHVKTYQQRPSELHQLWESSKDLKAIHTFFIALAISAGIFLPLIYYFDRNKLTRDIEMIQWLFQDIHLLFACYLLIYLQTLPFYGLTKLYLTIDSKRTIILTLIDLVFWTLQAFYYISTFYFATTYGKNFSPALRGAFVAHQCGIQLTFHSFYAENTWRQKSTSDATQKHNPSFKQFLYLMCSPTFLYRPSYPALKSRSYWNIFSYSVQFVLCIILMFYTLIPYWQSLQNFGKEPLTALFLINAYFYAIFYGIIAYMMLFYLVGHVRCNLMAELTRFGDRRFYGKWWQSEDFNRFWREWNTWVHDWIHENVYNPILMKTHNRMWSMIGAFVVSGLYHDWIFFNISGYYNVLTSILFMCLNPLLIVIAWNMKKKPENYAYHNCFFFIVANFLWSTLLLMYGLEFYARKNCASIFDSPITDVFVPRSITCFIK